MNLPDKWVRKAMFFTLNGMEVSGKTVYVFDIAAPNYYGDAYVLISTQSNSTDRTKCGYSWVSTCELQIVTRQPKNGGSRLLGNDITEQVIKRLEGLQLDTQSGLKILDQDIELPGDLVNAGEDEVVTQQILIYTFRIN